MKVNLDYNNFNIDDYPVIVQGYKVQIRKHKKKRINKKWIKRYGYRYSNTHTNDDQIIVCPCSDGTTRLFMNLKTYEKMKNNVQMIGEIKQLCSSLKVKNSELQKGY